MTTGFKLYLISVLLHLLVYLLMKWYVCKPNIWISQAPDSPQDRVKKNVLWCVLKYKKEAHFKNKLLLLSLSTRAPAVPITYTNIFSFSHICLDGIWSIKKKKSAKRSHDQQFRASKNICLHFLSFIQLASNSSFGSSVCCALLSRLKQIGPVPQITVASTLTALLGRSLDLSANSYSYILWPVKFICTSVSTTLNVAFPLWDSYSNKETSKSSLLPHHKKPCRQSY